MTMLTIKITNEEGREFILDGVAYELKILRRADDKTPEVYMDWLQEVYMDATQSSSPHLDK